MQAYRHIAWANVRKSVTSLLGLHLGTNEPWQQAIRYLQRSVKGDCHTQGRVKVTTAVRISNEMATKSHAQQRETNMETTCVPSRHSPEMWEKSFPHHTNLFLKIRHSSELEINLMKSDCACDIVVIIFKKHSKPNEWLTAATTQKVPLWLWE